MRFDLENKLNDFLVSIENEIETRKKQRKPAHPVRAKDSFGDHRTDLQMEPEAVEAPATKSELRVEPSHPDLTAVDDDEDLTGFIEENPWSGQKKQPIVNELTEESAPKTDPLSSQMREEDKSDHQDTSLNTSEREASKFPQVKIKQKKLTPKPKP